MSAYWNSAGVPILGNVITTTGNKNMAIRLPEDLCAAIRDDRLREVRSLQKRCSCVIQVLQLCLASAVAVHCPLCVLRASVRNRPGTQQRSGLWLSTRTMKRFKNMVSYLGHILLAQSTHKAGLRLLLRDRWQSRTFSPCTRPYSGRLVRCRAAVNSLAYEDRLCHLNLAQNSVLVQAVALLRPGCATRTARAGVRRAHGQAPGAISLRCRCSPTYF